MNEISREIVIPFSPRPHQKQIQSSLKRWNVLVCHRRFGKTVFCINRLIREAATCTLPRPRFAYIAPLYKQAKAVSWDYLKFYSQPIPGARAHESELRVDLPNEGRVQLYGADNPDSLRGLYLDGVVMDEYAQMPPALWAEVIRPALSDRKGWAIFIGTPKGRNTFCQLYEDSQNDLEWYGAMFKASETGIVEKEELVSARKSMSADQYAQEYECSFEAAIPGAYYGRLMAIASEAGRIAGVPHETACEVETWWDLGIGDPTSIWFVQRVGLEIHVIDYYEAAGEGLAHYANVLEEKRSKLGYLYGTHVVPHDADGKQLSTGLKLTDTMRSLGLTKLSVVPRAASIEPGIEAVRNLIPKCYFDREKCARGVEALRQYRQEWDDKRQAFQLHPFHDWTSHAADAFRTGAMYKKSTGFMQPINYDKYGPPKGKQWV